RADILEELQKSQKVFAEKLNHLSRRLAWINATIYSKEKMLDVYWLLCVCIRTIEHADNTGCLFAFTPEFYLNVAMNAYSALKNYFSPANSMEELPGKTSGVVLKQVLMPTQPGRNCWADAFRLCCRRPLWLKGHRRC
ncbi:hypothetical protein ILYODFUR_029437, partial [Ilyodon furcidens]